MVQVDALFVVPLVTALQSLGQLADAEQIVAKASFGQLWQWLRGLVAGVGRTPDAIATAKCSIGCSGFEGAAANGSGACSCCSAGHSPHGPPQLVVLRVVADGYFQL